MDQEKQLEELAIRITEHTGVSLEDASLAIMNVIGAFGEVAKAIADAFASISKFVTENKELIHQWQANEKRKKEVRKGWILNLDTTKPSQVMMNKPKFIVRKVVY